MSDDFTQLNIGQGGDYMDEVAIVYGTSPSPRKRPRVVITGNSIDTDVVARDDPADDSDMGLVVRNLPSAKTHPGNDVYDYAEITGISVNTETAIISHTVSAGTTMYSVGFSASGNMDAKFRLYLNGQVALIGRTTTSNPNIQMSFLTMTPTQPSGNVIELSVIHQNTGLSGTFEGTVLGYEIPN